MNRDLLRRQRRTFAGAFAGLLAGGLLLTSGCGTPPAGAPAGQASAPPPAPPPSPDRLVRSEVITVWPAGATTTAGLRWDLLTQAGYEGAEVEAQGDRPVLSGTAGWSDARGRSFIAEAHAHGVRALLVAWSMNPLSERVALGTTGGQALLLESLVGSVLEAGGDGLILDFRLLPGDLQGVFPQFVDALTRVVHAGIAGGKVGVIVPASGGPGYDLEGLLGAADWVERAASAEALSCSALPGPLDPIAGPWPRAATAAAERTSPAAARKLIVEIPLWAVDWPVVAGGDAGASAAAGCPSRGTLDWAEGLARQYGRRWDPLAEAPFVLYEEGGRLHQVWYEDAESLAAKSAWVARENLGGVALASLDGNLAGETLLGPPQFAPAP